MKSLTLHLIALLLPHVLLPLLLLLAGHTANAATSAATATLMATPAPTTTQPPSLHAPPPARRRLTAPTTVMTTTKTTTTTTTTKATTAKARTARGPTTAPQLLAARRPQRQHQQQQPQQQQQTVRRLAAAQTKSVGGQRVERSSPASASAPASTTAASSARLVRTGSASGNAPASSVRQNRSLPSAAETQAQRNGNTETATETRRYKHLERRQPNRLNQPPTSRNGDNTATTPKAAAAAAATTTTTTTPPPTSPTPSASTASPPPTTSAAAVSADDRQSSTSHQRRSKQSARLFDAAAIDAPVERAAHNSSASAAVIRLQQTPKTPRMIQRLVAGHIQNAEGRSTYQVSAVSSNSSVTNSTTLKPASLYFRRISPSLTSSYRHAKISSTPSPPIVATTTSHPLRLQNALASGTDDHDDNKDNNGDDNDDDDEALLNDPGDFDNWDNGILRLSAGSGKENSIKSKKNKDDSKKTLSDQVRDGKYGLIEKELFRRPPKRPGVLSYLPNKEVPIDNERTYGGLDEEDIWLAEDHLLVIKGGSLNDDSHDEPWPPIDDYDAPGRQIKLPPNPKVPPPFPVQLEENGPVQFVGNNKFTVVYPIANESIPIYPAGPEAGYPSSESDSDNEKNLITRPGAAQDAAEGEPGYLYPAPYPPWLYHNQTFVNPFLSNARPITFPGLGPFPFGRNGSLDHSNGTDYFDEDDPSLYYPPAYSFVYKNNYSNPVPPGPLVPGIVLPPPANQFSRLEKPEKTASTTTTPPASPPRHRVYTSTSTSTTTTTTSTTTTAPYGQVITKITEYTPQTIIITPEPPVVSTALPATPITKQPPTPPPTRTTTTVRPAPEIIEAVPVPVAVPIPVYPSNKYPSRPNVVNFVPTTPQPVSDTLSKTNPIYYEYFEAKRQPPVTSNGIDDFLSTTEKPQRPIKLYATSKRPFKSGGHQQQGHRTYLPPRPPQRPYAQQEVVYITPKPEVRYKRPPVAQPVPIYNKPARPLEDFEREVNAIRETLRYYQNQQLRDNSIPRTPKAKPIYEYSFDANKNLEPAQPTVGAGNFQPPAEFDEEPFKPMVTYSPPVDDENAFRAIAVDKVDGEVRAIAQQERQQQKYQSTTTLVPVQPEAPYQTAPLTKPKRLRIGAKYLQQPLIAEFRGEPELQYQSTPRPIVSSTQAPWSTLQQQELNEYAQPQQQQQPPVRYHAERLQLPPPPDVAPPKQRIFGGYYYNSPPPLQGRQNNRFYDEPFQQQNLRPKILNYRLPQNYPQQQQQQQHPQQPLWSLENDTYVNYAPNRPPLNPDAEFINPYQPQYQPAPIPYAPNQQGQRYGPPPPPISHQSQYYAPLQRLPQRQYQPQLHRDTLVNYRQPLPPLNPDSEYITHPRNQAQIYRSNAYRPQPSPTPPSDQPNLYYITPKYRRSNNNNNNNNNNNSNNAKPNSRPGSPTNGK